MKQDKEMILNAIAKANQTKKLNLDDITIHEGKGLGAEAVEKKLSIGSPILLFNVDNTTKDSLLSTLGITLPGSSAYLLIKPLGELSGKTVFHIIESNDIQEGEKALIASSSGTYYGGGEKPENIVDSLNEKEDVSDTDKTVLDIFAEALVYLWDTVTLQSAKLKSVTSADTESPPTKLWIWSKQYSQYCWGEKHNGYTPPTQTMTAYLTYKVQCYLDEAVTGNFQWMYVEILGYWDTNGMQVNKSSKRGWGNWAVKPAVTIPAGFNFYSCSPTNTNKTKTVTTTVGFEVGVSTDGISGSYSVSKSQTEEISDWEVILESINNWTYQQNSPFTGYRTSFPNQAVHRSGGRYKLLSWPNLTEYTFNFCSMSVFRTDTVLTDTVKLPINLIYEPGLVQIKNDNNGTEWKGYFWYYRSLFSENFLINMREIS